MRDSQACKGLGGGFCSLFLSSALIILSRKDSHFIIGFSTRDGFLGSVSVMRSSSGATNSVDRVKLHNSAAVFKWRRSPLEIRKGLFL